MTHIVICSSMKNLQEMKRLKSLLEKHGHSVKIPSRIDSHTFTKDQALALQEELRPAHLLKINCLPDDGVVLIVNPKGYIGYGTWTELAYAYALRCVHGKHIRIMTTEPFDDKTPGYEELAVFNLEVFNPSSFYDW